MQRIAALFVGVLAVAIAPMAAQQATGTTLWRVAATTLTVPPALAVGAAAALWNPAQPQDNGRLFAAFEAIQTPSAVDASGVIATVRLPAGKVGQVGLLYGRVGLSDLVQTVDSPDPTGSVIPVYTFAVGTTWSRAFGAGERAMNVGATLAYHETRLDVARAHRWTVDVGASRRIAGDKFRIAAATHFFSSLRVDDPAQDLYAGVEARLWHGIVSGERATLRGRYGLSFGHGFTADHQFGVGAELASTLALDLLLVREGSYGNGEGWRPAAGIRLAIGKYRVTLARDAGVNEVGSAYRVGVEARFK